MGMVDMIIVGIIAISALIGIFRGLIKEALSLASWFAAIIAGTLFSGQLADLMDNMINNDSLRRIAAFAILFIVVIFTGTIVSNLISKLTEAAGLKGADRILGGMFGVLRGMIIVLVIVFIGTQFDLSQVWFDSSILVPHAVAMIDYLQGFFGFGQAPAVEQAA
jgi:membrane protein required for colicin V production